MNGDLVGRRGELAELSRVVQDAAHGTGVVLLVRGDPGVGKSALLDAVVRLCERAGVDVLHTVGVEAEAQTPFAGLYQLLVGLLPISEELPDAERGALDAAFGLSDGQRPDPFLIARAATMLVAVAARRRPIVVIADDLQWLDAQSREALDYLSATVTDSTSVVGAVRSGYPGRFLPGARELVIKDLDHHSAAALLDRHAAHLSDQQRETVLAEAVGNPLALLELPASLDLPTYPALQGDRRDLSVRLERAFAARYLDLPPSSRNLVLVAATDVSDDLHEVMAGAATLTGRPLTSEELAMPAEFGLLRRTGDRIAFRHPLVRSGVLQSESLGRRQAAHAALAEVIDDHFRRTWHRAQAIIGPDDDVVSELEHAARTAVVRGAVTSAITYLERAAELAARPSERGHLLLKAAEHAFELGRRDVVDGLLDEARRTDLTALDGARMQWLREIFHDGHPGDAHRVEELCAVAGDSFREGDLDLALNLLLGAALRCWWADTGPNARARVVATMRYIGVADDPRHIAILAVTEPVLLAGEVSESLSSATAWDANGLRLLGMAAHAIGDCPRASRLLGRAAQLLRAQGRLGLLTQVLSMQVVVQLEIGDLRRAQAAMNEGLLLARQTGQTIWDTGTLACAARAEAVQGNPERAVELAVQCEVSANRQRLNDLLACVAVARGIAALDGGHAAEAFVRLSTLFDPHSPAYHQRQRFDGLMFLAEAAVTADRRPEARPIVAEMEHVARLTPSPLLHAHLSYARAVLAERADAERLFRAALAGTLDDWPWVRAWTERGYARWLEAVGRSAESNRWQLQAAARFDSIGAPTWGRYAVTRPSGRPR